jgi:hypothetical protein
MKFTQLGLLCAVSLFSVQSYAEIGHATSALGPLLTAQINVTASGIRAIEAKDFEAFLARIQRKADAFGKTLSSDASLLAEVKHSLADISGPTAEVSFDVTCVVKETAEENGKWGEPIYYRAMGKLNIPYRLKIAGRFGLSESIQLVFPDPQNGSAPSPLYNYREEISLPPDLALAVETSRDPKGTLTVQSAAKKDENNGISILSLGEDRKVAFNIRNEGTGLRTVSAGVDSFGHPDTKEEKFKVFRVAICVN